MADILAKISDDISSGSSEIAASLAAVKPIAESVDSLRQNLFNKANLINGKLSEEELPAAAYDFKVVATASGSETDYIITTENGSYIPTDGDIIRFQIHVTSGKNATLNIDNSGAKPIMLTPSMRFPQGNEANSWFIAVYYEALDCYMIQWGQKHNHQSDDVLYNGNALTGKIEAFDESLTTLTVGKSGQTTTINITSESTNDWSFAEGYWNGTYISTGGVI